MGFKKLFKSSEPATTEPPPTVSETQEVDTRADYAQRSARRRGLLSTLLSNRSRAAALDNGGDSNGGNKTLG